MDEVDTHEEESLKRMMILLGHQNQVVTYKDVHDMWKAHSLNYFAGWLDNDNIDSSSLYWMWKGWRARITYEETK